MRKTVIFVLCLTTALCLFGCGKKTSDETTTAGTTAPATENYSVVATDDLVINDETVTGEKVSQADGGYQVFYKENDMVKAIFDYGSDGKINKYAQYERDDKDNIISVINYDNNKKYVSATKYEYNPDGTVFRIYYYDAAGNIDYYEQDSYDENGVRTGILYDADGTVLAAPYETTAAKSEKNKDKSKNTPTNAEKNKETGVITTAAKSEAAKKNG